MTVRGWRRRWRWVPVARVGALSNDGRILRHVEVPDRVRAVELGHEGMIETLGDVELRQRAGWIEARLLRSWGVEASIGLDSLDYLVEQRGAPGDGVFVLDGVVGYVMVGPGQQHAWWPAIPPRERAR